MQLIAMPVIDPDRDRPAPAPNVSMLFHPFTCHLLQASVAEAPPCPEGAVVLSADASIGVDEASPLDVVVTFGGVDEWS